MLQSSSRSKSLLAGLAAGIAITAFAAILMGQGASQPVKSESQYFVTSDGDEAHLWVREGVSIRVVGHGACKECAAKGHDHGDKAHKEGEKEHKEGDGHDHAPAGKK